MNVVHQNMQGLSGKELELSLFIENHDVQVLCLTEHWLRDFEVAVFNSVHYSIQSAFVRKSAIRGGSLIIVSNEIKCKERPDIANLSVERTIELSCVELEQYIIICVYRPPSSDFNLFESVMEDSLAKVKCNNKQVIVCGDFNVNILELAPISIRLLNLFKSFNLNNLFCEPTRFTASSATCIDNIFSSCEANKTLLLTNITSDHCGQLASFSQLLSNKTIKVVSRPYTAHRCSRFKINIKSKLRPSLLDSTNPNEAYESVFNVVKSEFETTFKCKTRQVKSSSAASFNQWATTGIYKSRSRLYELYGMKKYKFDTDFIHYVRNYSKIFKKVCNSAKSKYISEKIKNSLNKVKATWNIINQETGKATKRDNNFDILYNNELVTEANKIASIFNNFFADIPLTTTSSLKSSSLDAENLLRNCVPSCDSTFSFEYVTPLDINNAFKSLSQKKTEDLWGFSVKLLSNIINIVAPSLAVIFNKCVDVGVFPDLMKHSKVIPLFKAGSRSDVGNFRPISILPAFSKIFEKLILKQLLHYFNHKTLLHSEQYGFTKGRSTTDAGVALLKHIYDAWESSQNAIGVFCDLSKAFDCVRHDTLLCKLKHYGVKNKSLDLINSYLSDRVQCVDVNGSKSTGLPVKLGVPQGSILGPFLFLVYINDLPFFLKGMCDVVLFADDTSLIFKVNRNRNDFNEINNTLTRVTHWFSINNLVLNAKKTKCIKFATPNVKNLGPNIVINNEVLETVESTVFLGVTVDAKLKWSAHIAYLANKLSSAAYAVRKVRQITDVVTARLVYFSYFHSVMSYSILLWGKAADIEAIFVLQKRAVRSIYQLGSRVSLKERFKEIGILTVASQFILDNILWIRQNLHLYHKKSDIHSINTRNKHKLIGTSHRLHRVHNSFVGLSVRLYNKLPPSLLELPFNSFKSTVKDKLCKKAYYTINNYLNDKNSWSP